MVRAPPQGGVISPMLSNILLHHELDDWFEKEVRLNGAPWSAQSVMGSERLNVDRLERNP
jgi:hypothetical protein